LLVEWTELYPNQILTDVQRASFMRELGGIRFEVVREALRALYAGSDSFRPTVGKILTQCRDMANTAAMDANTVAVLALPPPVEGGVTIEQALGQLGSEVVAAWRKKDPPLPGKEIDLRKTR
jgi:hypothetical protein